MLEADLQGARDDLVEVIVDPMKLSSYGLQLNQLIQGVGASNSLVAAGQIEGEEGKYAVKVPALIETVEDVANLPIVAGKNAVVRAQDLATIRSTFKDAQTITRLNGEPAIALEIKKRTGANLVDTVAHVKAIADAAKSYLPEGVSITYTQDKSTFIKQLLNDLQNHVLIAVLLVFIVILYVLSGRASMLIGLAIPSSFLMGILALALMGFTINMVVLFSLILAVGMLVDDAIIVTEFAERRMNEGMPKAPGLRDGRQAHGRSGDRRHADPHRGVLAAAVLAGRRRRLHEISADHADRDAGGLHGLRADLHADARRDVRQGARARGG